MTTRARSGSSDEVEDHWRYSQASTVSSGSIEMQRILLSRALLAAPMILDLGDDAKEYGRQALRAFEAAGGDQLVQQAEAKPGERESLAGPALTELGAWDLDARSDTDELEAAAALCRSAGYWALPYPVAERLARPADLDADGLIVVADRRPSGAVVGLESRWAAVSLTAPEVKVIGHGAAGAAFVAELELSSVDDNGADDRRARAGAAMLDAAWHARPRDRPDHSHMCGLRKQFGQPLSAFQGVQFQLTDAEVERSGFEILAKYALWSIGTGTRRGAQRRSGAEDVGDRGGRSCLPGVPPAARRGRVLRRDHAVVALPIQPAAAAAAARVCRRPGTC